MAVDLAQIEFPDLAAAWTHVLEPGQPGGERGPEGRIEQQLGAWSLRSVITTEDRPASRAERMSLHSAASSAV